MRALLTALALGVFFSAAAADTAVDPVCSMNVDMENPAEKTTFQGTVFFFCSHSCLKEFEAAPLKWSAARQNLRSGAYTVVYHVRQGRFYSGAETDVFFQVAPAGATRPFHPESARISCEASLELTPGKPETVRPTLATRRMKEDGWWGTRVRFLRPGHVEFTVHVRWDDGKEDEALFLFQVLPGREYDTGREYDGIRPSMVTQHETMRKIGRYWTAAGEALESGDADRARKNLRLVRDYQRYVGEFVPHHFEEEPADLKRLDASFGEALARVDAAVDSGTARDAWREVDALHCTKCHFKFRWGTFSDADVYPLVGR